MFMWEHCSVNKHKRDEANAAVTSSGVNLLNTVPNVKRAARDRDQKQKQMNSIQPESCADNGNSATFLWNTVHFTQVIIALYMCIIVLQIYHLVKATQR